MAANSGMTVIFKLLSPEHFQAFCRTKLLVT